MAFIIKKNHQGNSAAKQKAYQHLASLGILLSKLKRPEDIFYMGVPADADTYNKYAAAIAKRIQKIQSRLSHLNSIKPDKIVEDAQDLQDVANLHERNFLAILSVNAIAFSFNHKLPPKTEGQLINYLAILWGRSKLAQLLKKINDLPPQERGELILNSEIWLLDKEEFRHKEYKRSIAFEKKLGATEGLGKILERGAKEMNTATRLYYHLQDKAHWQEEQRGREVSYDRELGGLGDEGQPIYFRDTFIDLNPGELFDRTDRRIDIMEIRELMNKLPPAEKSAIEKAFSGERMNTTEQRAKNRGIKKLRAWIREKRL